MRLDLRYIKMLSSLVIVALEEHTATTKMHLTLYFTVLAVPVATLAAPANTLSNTKDLVERQTALVKPTPCIRNNSTSPHQTKKRSKAFAHAFIYTQNITKAFTYIVSDYIVRPHLVGSSSRHFF
jgi:hypothetical protein